MKRRVKGVVLAVSVAALALTPVAPVKAADCTEDLGMCVNKLSCSVAGAVNKIGNKVGTGDLVYCIY